MATYGTYDCNITNTVSTQLSSNSYGTVIEKPIYTYSYISNNDIFVSSGSNFTVNLQTETKRQFILNLAKELYVTTAFDMNPDKSLSSFALDAITRAKEFYKIASTSRIDENGKNVSLI